MKKSLNVLYSFEPFYRLSNLYKLEKKHYGGAEKTGREIYEMIKTEAESSPEVKTDSVTDDGYSTKNKNVPQTLFNPAYNFTNDEIIDEINTMIVAVSIAL